LAWIWAILAQQKKKIKKRSKSVGSLVSPTLLGPANFAGAGQAQ